jgi:methanol---5-hydroxybenzimidazolylcobamide Co-methyltransferase
MIQKRFTTLALDEPALVFGKARYPLERRGVVIGAGRVLPEIKFTLPSIMIDADHEQEICSQYSEMIAGVCRRAIELHQDAIVVEFELLPQMTFEPRWGGMITEILRKELDNAASSAGLRSLLRVTPVDIRETQRPPLKRRGKDYENVLESFRLCAQSGGDLLSIESVGGKEVTDKAIMESDIRGIIFGAGILGTADMHFLWNQICAIARHTGTVAAGDTACGIANTAMVLADRMYIPRVFAAVVRVIAAVRSLAAYEAGAVGPGKDCGYENIFLKAITGYPMSLEGKSAAGAHLSCVGNIAGAYADLWSNESIQNVQLLSASAPVVATEQLIYDCRLFNTALGRGGEMQLRDWLVDSDAHLDPQAYIFRPEIVLALAKEIVKSQDPFERSLAVAKKTVEELWKGSVSAKVDLSAREKKWLGKIEKALEEIPTDRELFVAQERDRWQSVVAFEEYGLSTT